MPDISLERGAQTRCGASGDREQCMQMVRPVGEDGRDKVARPSVTDVVNHTELVCSVNSQSESRVEVVCHGDAL